MNIRILDLIEGAKEATGVAVIIDVFRAFSLECYIMNNNPKDLIAVGDSKIAYDYKKNNSDALLVGERHGVMLDGFDYGNSPSALEFVKLDNKVVIHTTSAGTQGIINAKGADIILTGSLVNASAIAKYIKDNNFSDVSLVCMGLEGTEKTEEDTLCAEYIKSLLLDNPLTNLNEQIESLKHTSGAKFFDIKNKDVFPKEDFYLSTVVDRFNFVLKVIKKEDGFDHIERIDII